MVQYYFDRNSNSLKELKSDGTSSTVSNVYTMNITYEPDNSSSTITLPDPLGPVNSILLNSGNGVAKVTAEYDADSDSFGLNTTKN